MASYTTNLNLKKPAGSENVAIGDINNNMDTIDQAYGTLSDHIANKLVSYSDVEVTISEETTWAVVDLPYGVYNDNVVSVKIQSGTYRPLLFWKNSTGSKLWVLRLNTSGTNVFVDNTTGTFTVRIYYTV